MNRSPKNSQPAASAPLTTRREFVRTSLLACATATAGGHLAAAAAAETPPPTVGAKTAPPTAAAGAPPWPLFPYGSGEAIYLADFGECQPASAVSRRWQPNCWKLIDFEAKDLKGVMLTAGQNTAVPDVEFRVAQQGWFSIYFGLLSKYSESRLEVRLKGDETFSLLTHHNMAEAKLDRRDIELAGHNYTTRQFDELFWRCVKLDGANNAIVLRQLQVQVVPGEPKAMGNRFMPCWLGYIKLVPLAAAEVAALTADRQRRDTRRLFTHNDAFGSTSWLHFTAEADIRREIEPFRDTDFSRMYWEAGMGDVTYFPSKVGALTTFEWMKDHYRLRDRLVGQTYADFRAKGIDPFRVALDYSHQIGLEFHAAYRVAGFYFPAPEDEWNSGGLYHRHPEWRCVDRHGNQVPRMSYAFPGVRNFVIELCREIAAYPVDGICLLFNRRLPVLEYEAPLVESFQASHGIDPRTLADGDPRWLAHGAAVMTGFMRDLRTMLREEERRQHRSKPFDITAVVMGSREENFQYGLDLDAWVAAGLVDTLVPYSSVPGGTSDQVSWEDPRAAEYFIRLTKGTPCQLALNLMPRQILPEDYLRRAHALYKNGVENLFFWDCYQRNNFDRSWSSLSRLGHRDELAEWEARGRPAVERPQRTPTKIADWDLSYGTPG